LAPSENPVTRRGYHYQGQPGLVRVNLSPMDCQNPALAANVNGAGKLTQKSCPTRDDDWRSCLLSEAHPVLRAICAVLLLLVVYSRPASCEVPKGTRLLANKVAIQVFDCSGLLCGKIVWLARPRTTAGRPDVDHLNPDPKLRERPLCGLTILWGLRRPVRSERDPGVSLLAVIVSSCTGYPAEVSPYGREIMMNMTSLHSHDSHLRQGAVWRR
jgi:hypothetical protein